MGHPVSVAGKVSDDNDQLPVSTFVWDGSAVGVRCFRQGNDGFDIRLERAGVQHLCNFYQLPLICFDDEEGVLVPWIGMTSTAGSNGDKPSAWFEHAPGSVERLASNAVEDHVYSLRPIFKA
jgi:hypothetical protein